MPLRLIHFSSRNVPIKHEDWNRGEAQYDREPRIVGEFGELALVSREGDSRGSCMVKAGGTSRR